MREGNRHAAMTLDEYGQGFWLIRQKITVLCGETSAFTR
jgi:hypothetical protein